MSRRTRPRRGARHFGENLSVVVNGESYPVLNISSSGLSFRGVPLGDGIVATLQVGSDQEPERKVDATCVVTAIRKDVTHVSFTRVTMTLLTFIIDHIGTVLGVEPYYFGGKADTTTSG